MNYRSIFALRAALSLAMLLMTVLVIVFGFRHLTPHETIEFVYQNHTGAQYTRTVDAHTWCSNDPSNCTHGKIVRYMKTWNTAASSSIRPISHLVDIRGCVTIAHDKSCDSLVNTK